MVIDGSFTKIRAPDILSEVASRTNNVPHAVHGGRQDREEIISEQRLRLLLRCPTRSRRMPRIVARTKTDRTGFGRCGASWATEIAVSRRVGVETLRTPACSAG